MSARFEERYETLIRKLPPRLAALVDAARPAFKAPWGGAFNGQSRRARLFEDLMRTIAFSAIVETGTYRGTTTEFLRERTTVPIFTVEADARFYHYARWRFRRDRRVHVLHGDSRALLRHLMARTDVPRTRVFFYLDAHWNADLPLNEELGLIADGWTESVVMIDDFKVADDPGYGFDDYGPRKQLSFECIPAARSPAFRAFWPSARAAEEDGQRRGCIVLTHAGPTADAIGSLASLRRALA